ncbi:hypothetical protein M8J76_013532 [Diaphorina citri]|nr:hypothetical protein M8J75_000303 [Diaphorina citri]KAI5750184.1 hypothetical protein M8J76_013532 [Diaphorina citri]KAI5756209.1 hypothetical protein M8J77_022996 [Diaphorina citri]
MSQAQGIGKPAIIKTDMTKPMQSFTIAMARKILLKTNNPKAISQHFLREFNRQFKPNWHCVVGHCYGACVSFQKGSFMYLSMGPFSILLFKIQDEAL